MACEHIRNELVARHSIVAARWCPDCGAIFRPPRWEWELPADQPAATETGPHEVRGHTFTDMTEDCVKCGCKWMHRFGLDCRSPITGESLADPAPQGAPCLHTLNELGHCTRCGARPNDKPHGAPTCDRYPCCKPRKPGSVYCSEHAYWVPNDRPQGAPDPTEDEVAVLEKWADSFYGKEWREPQVAPRVTRAQVQDLLEYTRRYGCDNEDTIVALCESWLAGEVV